MIEYPRLLYMANRVLHFDRYVLSKEDIEARINMNDKTAEKFSDDDKLFENYSP